jgi:hypothetical protein
VATAMTATASFKLANDMVSAILFSGAVNITHFKNPGSLLYLPHIYLAFKTILCPVKIHYNISFHFFTE